MFTSKRKLFSAERGSATSWLAGITAAALIIGAAALPAVADEVAPTESTLSSVEADEAAAQADEEQAAGDAAAKAAEEQAAADAAAKAAEEQAAAAEEAILVPPVEEEIVDETPIVEADDPAPPAEESPADESAPAAVVEPVEVPATARSARQAEIVPAVDAGNCPGCMTVADHEGERNPDPDAAPTNGNDVWTDGNSTTYRELDYVNLRFTITSSGRAAGFVGITFDTQDAKCLFYDGTFAGGWIQDPVGGVRPVGNPSDPGSGDFIEEIGGLADDDANASLVGVKDLGSTSVATVKVEFEKAGSARFYYHLRLSDDAGACTGVKLVKLGNADPANIPNGEGDDFANVAARTVPHPAKDVLQNPSITVRKFIPDPEGGWQLAPADSWEFCGDKVSLLGGDACKNNPAVWNEVIAATTGTNFTFTENQLVGPEYQFDHVDGDNCVAAGTTAVATVAADFDEPQNAVCNFYNTPAPGSLQLVKRVVNDNGGTATWSAFGLTTSAGSLTFGDGTADGADTVKYSSNVFTVEPGEYTFSEDNVAGYTEGDWSCTGAEASGTAYNAGSVTVPNGGTVVCTITNDDNAPALYLKKVVINDNGGAKSAGDWTLYADALSVAGSVFGAKVTDQAGTYDLSESVVAGYTNTSLTCDDNPGVQVDSVTLGLGQTKTCTFVNDDNAPALYLKKHVVNNNGGTKLAADWTLSAGAYDVTGSESGAKVTDQAGTYDLSESAVAGYTNTSLTCDDNPGVQVDSVTLGLGQTKTCTFVNDDNAPALYLKKHVVNDNGGTKLAGDWTLSAGAYDVTGSESGAKATDQVGTYDLSEIGGRRLHQHLAHLRRQPGGPGRQRDPGPRSDQDLHLRQR